jgi:hypothetical protein
MNDHDPAAKLLEDHFTATAALIALMLKKLPDEVRTRTLDTLRNGTGKVQLRTRVESNGTELLLLPTMGQSRCGCRRFHSIFSVAIRLLSVAPFVVFV